MRLCMYKTEMTCSHTCLKQRWAQKALAMRAVGSKLKIPPMEAPSWKTAVRV